MLLGDPLYQFICKREKNFIVFITYRNLMGGRSGMVGLALAHNPVLVGSNPLGAVVKGIHTGYFLWSQHL